MFYYNILGFMNLNIHAQDLLDQLFAHAPKTNSVDTKLAKAAIQKCVAKWSTRNSSLIRDIFYKLGQAFMSIFGCSDWQRAKFASFKAISTNFSIKKEMVPVPLAKILSKIADKALEILIIINNRNLPQSQNPILDAIFQAQMTKDLPEFGREIMKDIKAAPWNDGGLLQKTGIDLGKVVGEFTKLIKTMLIANNQKL